MVQDDFTVLVIGLGSMGKRRTQIFRSLYPTCRVVGVDDREERCREFRQTFGLSVYSELTDALDKEKAKLAVVSTSPLSHGDIVSACLKAGLHVFTEINLTTQGYDENMGLAHDTGKVLFLSSTFLYRRETEYIGMAVKNSKEPLNYMYHVGQYLPDWHPWEDYRDYFVAKRETNACRELFAIELPWLLRAFGKVEKLTVMSDKMSRLELPYHDNYMVMLRHAGGHKGILVVDVVSREARRDFCVYGENLFLEWDGTPGGLRHKDLAVGTMKGIDVYGHDRVQHDDRYSVNIIENAYENEIKAFIAAVAQGTKPIYGYAEDRETLAVIDCIEKGGDRG